MAKKLLLLPIFILPLMVISFESDADVLVDDADSATQVNLNTQFTSADVPTGSGQAGDFELIACSIPSYGINSFLTRCRTPGQIWIWEVAQAN